VGHRDTKLSEPRAEEWLLIEWPPDEAEPTKYWFAPVPEDVAFDQRVDIAKLRWRIERDYQELKQELGLGDYEGRGWRGFHHHATLCIAASGFLIAERGALPPSGPTSAALWSGSGRPHGYRPRGAADPTRTTRPQRDRHSPATAHRSARQDPPEMPLLQRADPQNTKDSRLLKQ
jgi:Transposase DDE domain